MKFVIEAAGLTVAGGKELALDLLTHLARHSEHQFTFIVPDLPGYKNISGGNIHVCKKGSGLLHRASLLNHEVPRICRAEGADALLCLGNFVPRKRVCPTAVLLQNAWIVYRDPVAEARRTLRELLVTAYGRYAYRHLPDRTTVITQTQVMKDRLCRRYGVAPGRVTIIPNTLSLAQHGENPHRIPAEENLGGRPFTFLCLAHCYAHKNIDILLDAVQKLPNYTHKTAKCIITVAREQHPRARHLLERLDRGELAGRIENIGPVPSALLPQIYQRADALIFPTLLESFSRTYLEAMYFRLPILTSDRDFAHHLCRDAAVYFDPLDAANVAQAMARTIEDADLRYRLVENGQHMLAQALNWEEIAANFVEVLERTAREQGCEKAPGTRQKAESGRQEAEAAVRTLFNQKARRWRSKYGPKGKLSSRVEQFIARLGELCPPPANILDLGCGTGEIAAAMNRMAYHVTACDVAEEMLDVARGSHSESAVKWVYLAHDREVLPFASASFDAVVASSVFEYLDDVPRMAAELARILRPEGVLLLTVPNPCNVVRRVEARLRSVLAGHRFPPLLRRVQRADSYAAYLRLSRNRFDAAKWQSVLSAARFTALDERDFSPETWRDHAKWPLVLLAVKKAAARGVDESLVLSHAAHE